MKSFCIITFCFALVFLVSCSKEKAEKEATLPEGSEQQLRKLSEALTVSETNDDLNSFMTQYTENAISMPEYQPILQGNEEIKNFYKEIFERQKIKAFERNPDEIITLGNTIIEIGTFKKEYTQETSDTLITQNGKYWNVWDIASDGRIKLKGESFGYFHPVEHPEDLILASRNIRPETSDVSLNKEIPFELKAYNALMEKGVRLRDGVLRSEFFASDGSFMPFADSTVSGMDKIKPYLLAYSNRGKVTIDSISVYTYHAEYFDEYVLEYPKFRVKWTTGAYSGRTQGKGIRIWKRQGDKSLKLYREIGTHDHLQ
jgi:ketosteroid isomerase-like protein